MLQHGGNIVKLSDCTNVVEYSLKNPADKKLYLCILKRVVL